MKIAHLVSTFPPYSGGMGNTCHSQVKELVKLGHQVTVFTPYYSKINNLDQKEQQDNFNKQGFRVVYCRPLFKFGNAAFVPQIVNKLKDYDLIYLHWPFLGGLEMILLAKLLGLIKVPLITQYHMNLIAPDWRELFFKVYLKICLPLLVKSSTKIICSSEDYLKHSQIKKWALRCPEKFQTIALGTDIQHFCPREKKQELLNEIGINKNKIKEDKDLIVLLVGGLDSAHYFKGVEVLIQALANIRVRNKDVKAIVVGEGSLKEKFLKLAQDLSVADQIIFPGRASYQGLANYYCLADVCILPSTSYSEAFGLVLVEAMASAKPIIVSDLPGPRTLVKGIGDDKTGFTIRSKDADDLAKKIEIFLNDRELAKEMGKNGRRLVEEKYTWPKVVKELEKVYLEVLNKNK